MMFLYQHWVSISRLTITHKSIASIKYKLNKQSYNLGKQTRPNPFIMRKKCIRFFIPISTTTNSLLPYAKQCQTHCSIECRKGCIWEKWQCPIKNLELLYCKLHTNKVFPASLTTLWFFTKILNVKNLQWKLQK